MTGENTLSEREKHIMEAIESAEKIRGQAFDAEASLEAVEGARRQLSVANDELRGQSRMIKDRVNWLILELDKLIAKFKALEGQL